MERTVNRPVPILVVGGVSSGVGKTTVVAALAAAFRARGLEVGCYKAGPDYLDPSYHRLVSGRACHNLDGWMMGEDAVRATVARTSGGLDLLLLEGVMGLFDGASPSTEVGSTAQIAKWLGAPVILVADAGGLARSIAAIYGGFRDFDEDLQVAGLIANRVGSRGHLALLGEALGGGSSGPLLGGFPKALDVTFPSRHLGLLAADDSSFPQGDRDRLAELAEEWLDLERLLTLAQGAAGLPSSEVPRTTGGVGRVRIGIARDEAFHFYYEENLRLLEQAGAQLVDFSPIHDQRLPEVQGLIIGGGYPEAHAKKLAANHSMLAAVRAHAGAGKPVYAECGGLMYLSDGIVDGTGTSHDLVGVIPGRAHMQGRIAALGYVEVELQRPTFFGGAGVRFRGHQFRYSELKGGHGDCYRVRRRRGGETFQEGYGRDHVLASYVHAHWASHPQMARSFVEACASLVPGTAR